MNRMKTCNIEQPACSGNSNGSCVDGFDNPFHMRYSAYEFYVAHAEWVVPRLKELRDHGTGCPASFVSCKNGEAYDNGWDPILTKMIRAFEAIAKEEADDPNSFEHYDFVEQGLDLFREYYFSLWD